MLNLQTEIRARSKSTEIDLAQTTSTGGLAKTHAWEGKKPHVLKETRSRKNKPAQKPTVGGTKLYPKNVKY